MMRLIFIRHGQTTGDVEDRFGGAYDDGLSEEGFLQAEKLAGALVGKEITQIVTSGLLRARQTGEILARGLGVEASANAELNERNQYGALSGMVKAEAREKFPELVEGFKDRLFTVPGTESYENFRLRIEAAFAVLAQGESGVAVVWHGGGMRVLFRDILKLGELKTIGDCCRVELDLTVAKGWQVVDADGIEFGWIMKS